MKEEIMKLLEDTGRNAEGWKEYNEFIVSIIELMQKKGYGDEMIPSIFDDISYVFEFLESGA